MAAQRKHRDPLTPRQSKLVTDNYWLVEHVVRRYWHRGMGIVGVEFDDMIQYASIGLIQAAQSWDRKRTPTDDVDLTDAQRFRGFARYRMNGAMKDGLRESGWSKRNQRVLMDHLDRPYRPGEDGTGNVQTLADTIPDDPFAEDDMLTDMVVADIEQRIRDEAPDDRSRAIWAAHVAGEKLATIAECEGLTESRICQIVGRASRAAAGETRGTIWPPQSPHGMGRKADARTTQQRVAFWMGRGCSFSEARERVGLDAERLTEHQRRRRRYTGHPEVIRRRRHAVERARDFTDTGFRWGDVVSDAEVDEWRAVVA